MNRRTLLCCTLGTSGIVGLAGCSGAPVNTASNRDGHAPLDRIVCRADTGQAEQVDLTLVYAPRDGSTTRPIWGSYEAPAAGDTRIISDFDGEPGFYSLTARSVNDGSTEISSFNSYGNAVGGDALHFEVVVTRTGDVWVNLNEAGESISIPGY